MKIKIKLTTEVYVMTMLCGTDGKSVIENCAIAYSVRRIAPKAIVTYESLMNGSNAIPGCMRNERFQKICVG